MGADPFPALRTSPIVEAVVDIDCDLAPAIDFASLDVPARVLYSREYPKRRGSIVPRSDSASRPSHETLETEIESFQFLTDDERQLVQVRRNGFSFNRLAPYSSLDDYLPEIEKTWRLYVSIANPVRIRRVALRFINRVLLPIVRGTVDLDDYLRLGPRLPDENGLRLTGFTHQHSAVEARTGHQVNITLLMEMPVEDRELPIVFEIEVIHAASTGDVEAWQNIAATIASLRSLKNQIFRNTLTEKCLSLFR